MTMRTGGCRCGATRYILSAAPMATRLCWCRDCRYWAAGSATLNLVVARAAVAVDGTPAGRESLADSGHHMRRSFCARCGTPLFSESRENPDVMVVRAGSLDDAGGIAPDMVIWTDSAPAWARFDPALPAYPRQPG